MAVRSRTESRALAIQASLLSDHLESLQRRSTLETGLLLAHVGAQADAVLHFVPTPSQDDGAPQVDASWMVTHAEAVSHMLPGGIAVVGAYLFSPSGAFASHEAKLRPVLAAALKRLREADGTQSLLMLLPSDARKATARALVAGSASLKPIELKTTISPPRLICLEAAWVVQAQLRLLPPGAGGPPQLAQLKMQLAPVLRCLDATTATVDGSCWPAGALCSQLAQGGAPHSVRLFGAFRAAEAAAGEGGAEGGEDDFLGEAAPRGPAATVRLRGVVRGRAFAAPKEAVEEGVRRLRRDLACSLERRVALLLEDLAEEEEEEGGGVDPRDPLPTAVPGAWALPRRAHFAVGGGLSLCDYVAEGDDAAEMSRDEPRCAEMRRDEPDRVPRGGLSPGRRVMHGGELGM